MLESAGRYLPLNPASPQQFWGPLQLGHAVSTKGVCSTAHVLVRQKRERSGAAAFTSPDFNVQIFALWPDGGPAGADSNNSQMGAKKCSLH